MSAQDSIRHRQHCTSDDTRRWMGRRGDVMETCEDCGAVGKVPTAPPAVSTPPPDPAAVRSVCPAHLVPVSWKGTGCRQCRAEVTNRRRARAARRTRASEHLSPRSDTLEAP